MTAYVTQPLITFLLANVPITIAATAATTVSTIILTTTDVVTLAEDEARLISPLDLLQDRHSRQFGKGVEGLALLVCLAVATGSRFSSPAKAHGRQP